MVHDEKNTRYQNPELTSKAITDELVDDFYPWYEKSTRRNATSWGLLQFTTLLCGVASSILSAISNNGAFITNIGMNANHIHIAAIIVPAIGALSSGILIQFRCFELSKLREKGRVEIQALIHEAKGMISSAKSEDDHIRLHKEIRNRILQIERQQSDGFYATLDNIKSTIISQKTSIEETKTEQQDTLKI